MCGREQQASLGDAFKAHTVKGAFQKQRDHDLDELPADPITANPENLSDEVKVLGTRSTGRRVDAAACSAFSDRDVALLLKVLRGG